MEKQSPGKLEIIATKTLAANEELIKLVDFLNKNLKHKNVIFGVTKNQDKMSIVVYETE